jgi:hypothetical protein
MLSASDEEASDSLRVCRWVAAGIESRAEVLDVVNLAFAADGPASSKDLVDIGFLRELCGQLPSLRSLRDVETAAARICPSPGRTRPNRSQHYGPVNDFEPILFITSISSRLMVSQRSRAGRLQQTVRLLKTALDNSRIEDRDQLTRTRRALFPLSRCPRPAASSNACLHHNIAPTRGGPQSCRRPR